MIKDSIKKIPNFIKQPIRFLYGYVPVSIRYGKVFKKTYNLLQQSQWWSKEQHETYQVKELQQLLIHSYNNVPYYKKIFQESGFNPYEFKYLDQMSKIPYLTKEVIQLNFEDLIAKNFKINMLIPTSTGGTTGNQLKFLYQRNFTEDREWAYVCTQWNRIGFNYKNSKRIIIRNNILPKDKLYLWDKVQNALIINPFQLTDDNLKIIIEKMNMEEIPYIHTYPSTAAIICDYIKRTGIRLTYKLKGVFATSENIYPGQREFIEGTLKTRVFSFYGHSERLIFAGECEKSNLYHVFSEYGYLELINQNGNVIDNPNEQGEIIGTGFNNYAMPFIRYRTADYAKFSEHETCECGRNYKLLESVEGRWLQEMLITSNGNKISITSINMHSNIFDNVKQFQFLQEKPGQCILKVIKNAMYSQKDENIIRDELGKKLTGIKLDFDYIDNILKTQSGKYRYLIQKIK